MEFEISTDLFSAGGAKGVCCFGIKISLLKAIQKLRDSLSMSEIPGLCIQVGAGV